MMVYRFTDADDDSEITAIPLSDATREGKDAEEDSLEETEEELGFEQQEEGIWFKDYG